MWGPGGGKNQTMQAECEVWRFNGLVKSFFFLLHTVAESFNRMDV